MLPNAAQELWFKISFENYSSTTRNRMDNIVIPVFTTHICENLHDICHSYKEVIDIAITQLNWINFCMHCFLFLIHSFVSVSVHVDLLSAP